MKIHIPLSFTRNSIIGEMYVDYPVIFLLMIDTAKRY